MSSPSTTDLVRPDLSPAKRALLAAILAGRTRAPEIVRGRHGADVPLSFAQERLWFLHRLQQGGTAYASPAAARLSGALDAAALERALGEVVRRHEALRTTFREVDGAPVQRIVPFAGFTLPVEDLSALVEAEREAAVRRRCDEDGAWEFDLVAGPLFRARLLRLGVDEHVLLLCMHHIVCDGWSMDVLFREMWTLYGADVSGEGAALPDLPVQYADYAVWQRAQAGSEREARQVAYWKARLAGAPELLELPADRPRPARPSLRGARVPVEVPAAVAERLRDLARGEGATLYMAVLAAFQVLLARYAGAEDVVVGTPVAGRTRQEVEGLIGLFMNTLALRTDVSGDPTFRQALGRVRETVLGAYEHQEVPFERVVAEVQPQRSLNHSPLFQVVFQLDEGGAAASPVAGLAVRPVEADPGTAKFDLTLALDAHADGIDGTLEYATDLFDRATAQRMAHHLVRALEQAAAGPDVPLSSIELMDGAERRRVLEDWNRTEDTDTDSAGATLPALFAAQVAATPDAVALVFGDAELTYRELDERSNRLAHHLVLLGAGPEARVAICLERSAEMVVAMLAVLKAGAAYLPLDPAYPVDRLAYMLEDSGAAVLVTRDALRGLLPSADVRTVAVDGDAAAIDTANTGPVRGSVHGGNAAYVIYTSGSTGRPKGVVVTHANAASFFAGMDGRVGGTVPGTWLAVTRIGFDIHVLELLWTLLRGFRVIVHPDIANEGAGALADAIRRHAVTHLQCTPSLASLLIAESGVESLAGLDRVLLGGEPLPADLASKVAAILPGGLINMYGPTETTVWSTTHAVGAGEARVPIGRPIAGTRAYVLDAALRPQPAGIPGELFLGGPGVTRGYLGRPALTAERYLPDPFDSGPGGRLYRTGDRARWRHDGVLECLGRVDQQVKIRGYRIEPGEIEAALRGHPAVRECVVVAREDRPGDRRLAAYVTGEDPTAAELRAHLRGTLPEHMVPSSFTVLPALPLLPNGKLDRGALPEPRGDGGGAELDEPRNYAEVQLIQLWEGLLGVAGITPTQGFFDLGGDSFLALHLFARVNRAFGCDLPVATLFAGGTVRHMADAILEQQASAETLPSSVVALQPGGSLPPLFVVHAVDRGVMGYVNLVRHLGPDQPVYGLRDVGELDRPVARIAADHVAAVRSVQPRGPYAFVGWSFGGTVAYEMATLLEAEGETVAFLGMLDTLSPVLVDAWPWSGDLDTVTVLAQEVADRMRRPFSLAGLALEGLDPVEQVRRVAEALLAQDAAPPGFDGDALAEQCRENRARNRSREGHVPGRLRATLTLFRATDVPGRITEFLAPYTAEERRTLAWSRYVAGAVEVHPVPGTHATLGSEPHARTLADHMRRALAAARHTPEPS
ncbi:MAG: Malonyl CoA-acyl carrier protein transacylase [Gemmatimonadetes bacterium]|nr:Malonyl CoA-acyl carrier protein transacylase [Gemmatimonadota bacterium]